MKRRHWRYRGPVLAVVLAISLIVPAACAGPRATANAIRVMIRADGNEQTLTLPGASTVQQALEAAGISLGPLDQVDPPAYTVLEDGTSIRVTRITEQFQVETTVLPFERQTIRNEGLPAGESRLLQPGSNGEQETTYRVLIQEGQEISRVPIKQVVIRQPVPEIVMIGAQMAYSVASIDGSLAYLAGGNAWLMTGNSANRRPIMLSGDLDGRIFRLSPDGRWLLFTRQASDPEQAINNLWAISTTDPNASPIDLKAHNIVNFADWAPHQPAGTFLSIAYSTVEPSPSAPGWQANNDLVRITFTFSGRILDRQILIDANSGGQYGWWGTDFVWSTDNSRMAYARADGLGTVDLDQPGFDLRMPITPLQTLGDWAWVPGLGWGDDGRTIFAVLHGETSDSSSAATSPVFDLAALTPESPEPMILADRVGMFADPSVSPAVERANGELAYQIAYLQAATPLESQDSRYRLMVIDRDGSNRRQLFPEEGEAGLAPGELRPPAWSPDASHLAIIYRGDLWIVESSSGRSNRLTTDGQVAAYSWSP
jgi:hypothetical protein